MSQGTRVGVFVVSAGFLAVVLGFGLAGLAPLGSDIGAYAAFVNSHIVELRHVTDTVAGTVFDIRAFDSLGEETALFTAAVATVVLLRRQQEEVEGGPANAYRKSLPLSPEVRSAALRFIPVLALYAIWIIFHGHLSPGGGFQGGLALAGVFMLFHVVADPEEIDATFPKPADESADAVGAGLYLLVGLAALAVGAIFLENVLPLGVTGSTVSGGTILVISAVVGLEAAGGATVVWREFLDQAQEIRLRHRSEPDE